MISRLTLASVTTGVLVAFGISAAQAATIPPPTIPSGTEVVPHVTYDSRSGASLVKLYDPETGKDETIESTEGTDSYLWRPQLSEDGKRVFFADYYGYGPDDEREESIAYIPSDGGERTRVVTAEGVSDYDLSRDGGRLLYQAFGGSEIRLFTAPVDGSAAPTEVPVPANFSQVLDPIFNKNGTGIFFTGIDNNDTDDLTGGQLFYMNLDGTGVEKLTDFVSVYNPETYYSATQAGWYPEGKELSPDGDTIVFHGYQAMDGTGTDNYRTGIYTLPVSGGAPREVAVSLPGEASLTFPHYNQDGSRIMYSQLGPNPSDDPDAGSGPNNIYSVSLDGSGKQLLGEDMQEPGNWGVFTPALQFDGFYQPVDNLPTLNKTKPGKTIPVRFRLGGDRGLDIFAEGYPKSETIPCNSSAAVDGIEVTLTGKGGLSYSAATGRYEYAWATSGSWTGCRQFVMKLKDGTVERANFIFR